MSEDQDAFVWLNGTLVQTRLARIDPSDRGLLLGDGLFETIHVTNGAPRHVGLHLARLRQGAAQLDIRLPFEDTQIQAALVQTLAANRLSHEAVLRLTLTRGAALRGLTPVGGARPTFLISATAFVAAPATLTTIICRTTRRNEFSPLAAIKSLNYLDNILARSEAVMKGAEDAILLNTQGDVAEATAANLFLLRDGKWLTPRLQDGALPGIFRGRVLLHHAASETRITETDLLSAQSICLGNALGLRAVSQLDGRGLELESDAITALRAIFTRDN